MQNTYAGLKLLSATCLCAFAVAGMAVVEDVLMGCGIALCITIPLVAHQWRGSCLS